ncbi:MAG TPA: ABC transporter ATP-binding protein [Humisphaera sp.]
MAHLVEISGLSFGYGSQLVLEGIDLAVEQGTTLGLIGPNGGGKTTLMKLMLGLLTPTKGTIRIAGLPPRQAVRKGDLVGYLPQRPRPPSGFPATVRQVVRMGLAGKTGLLRSHSRDDLAFADALIDRVGLAGKADEPVGSLSGGQLQRAYIARALAPRPKLLLLDEPTVGVDRAGQERFITFIQELKTELGLTLVFVSHDLRAVSAISDRIACLNCSLHYHDVPDHLPADLVYRMFACDLEAMGIRGGHVCTHGAQPVVPLSVGGSKPRAAAATATAEASVPGGAP